MTPLAIERVFGRDRLKMVTGRYVEVFREAAAPGERRRYTKRFLSGTEGDFRLWTEREWRLLARLVGHGVRHVPEIVQFDRGSDDKATLVQTYDAGVTIDHWATLLPVQRDGRVLQHVFRDCAHWWTLAQNFLQALKEIHQLQLVHLDIKADNVCIPLAPTLFNPHADGRLLFPVFEQLALIDFAFSLVTGERLESPLPIGAQLEFPYQSPRLLSALAAGRKGDMQPTRELDWRCDMFSLATLLERLLPPARLRETTGPADGWSDARYAEADALLRDIRDAHDRDAAKDLPHDRLVDATRAVLRDPDLTESLERGWTLSARPNGIEALEPTAPLTPLTRIEAPTRLLTLMEEYVAAAAAQGPFAATDATQPTQLLTVVEERAGTATPEPPAETDTALPTLPTLPLPIPSTPAAASVTEVEPRASLDTPPPAIVADAEDEPLPEPKPAGPAAAASALQPAVRPDTAVAAAPLVPDEAVVAAIEPDLSHGSPAAPPARLLPRHRRTLGYATAAVVAVSLLAVIANVAKPRREATAPSSVAATRQPAADARGSSATPSARPPETAGVTPDAPRPEPTPPAVVAAGGRDPAAPENQAPQQAVARPPAALPPVIPPAAEPAASAPSSKPDEASRVARDAASDALRLPSQQAATQLDRVLRAAARAEATSQDRTVLQAIESLQDSPRRQPVADTGARRAVARKLNASARDAFWNRRSAAEALALQRQAFDANPLDPEIAGNLAFYYLKTNPPQPDSARKVALHALAAAAPQTGSRRVEDWGNLAVASALTARPQDATNALFVMLAVSKDLDRTCRSALSMAASFGPRLKPPVEAMFARIHSRGQARGAPHCAWPPRWSAGMQFP